MGRSATIKWLGNDGTYGGIKKSTSAYFPHGHIILLANPTDPKMAAIIHEINECEVSIMLNKIAENKSIRTDSKVITKNMWLFDPKKNHIAIRDQIPVSHIISPYGCCCCAMPRKQYRAIW